MGCPIHSLHECVHIPHTQCGSDGLHHFYCFYEEMVHSGAQVKPLSPFQAGSTKWMRQLPSLRQWWVSHCQWFSDSQEVHQVLQHWSPWESNGWLPWGRQRDAQGWPQDSVFHHDAIHCDSVYHPLPLSMKGRVGK